MYNNRGVARKDTRDLDGAIEDYSEAIRVEPHHPVPSYNRAIVRQQKADYSAAIADYQKYRDLGGRVRNGNQEEVEQSIRELRKKTR